MSKLSFRARALDAAKPLPIYRNRDLPDLNDCVSINRAVPQMPTGMEKEEESVCYNFNEYIFIIFNRSSGCCHSLSVLRKTLCVTGMRLILKACNLR